jgi:hypothetical protein
MEISRGASAARLGDLTNVDSRCKSSQRRRRGLELVDNFLRNQLSEDAISYISVVA